jgi:ribosomal protein L1
MEDIKKVIEEKKAHIERLRDEIKLQAHLGKEDAKDELEKLEKDYEAFLVKIKPFTDEVEQTLENTGDALGLVADELKAGYERISKLFK